MNGLCQYSDIFGKPGKGVHSVRLFNIAIFDVIMMMLAAFLIAYYTKYNFGITLIVLFIIGILVHYMFCVDTTVNKWLNGIFA